MRYSSLFLAGFCLLMLAPADAQVLTPLSGPRTPSALLQNDSVQKEIKISEEQKRKIPATLEKIRGEQREWLLKLRTVRDPVELERAHGAFYSLGSKTIDAILEPEQRKRFRQIRLQQAGAQAFTIPEVIDELKLTADQRARIRDLQRQTRRAVAELAKRAGNVQAQVEALEKQAAEGTLAILSEEQKARWKEMAGPAFEVKIPNPEP